MAIIINTPFGGGQTDIELGRSRLAPRDTFGTSPEGLRGAFNDRISQTGQLVDALSGLTRQVANIEKEQQERELKETEGLAASVMGQLDPNSPFAPQVANLIGDRSPKLQAAVLEAVGRNHASVTAQSWIEGMAPEDKASPQRTDEYFTRKLAEENARLSGQNFYGPSYINQLSEMFKVRSRQLSSERTREMESIIESDYTTNRLIKGGYSALTNATGAVEKSAALLRKFEGFIPDPKWDRTAYRLGYGTDTITKADGTVIKVTPGTRVSKEDAERDLARRIPEFQRTIVGQIGEDAWNRYSDDAKAALTSVAYNYGSLPKRVVEAIKSGNPETAAKAIESLQNDNEGINRGRRLSEAAVIRGGGPAAGEGQPVRVASVGGLPTPDTPSASAKTGTQQGGTTAASASVARPAATNSGSLFTDDGSEAPLRPDVERLRQHFMSEDQRYRSINGDTPYTRQKSKNALITAAIAIATNKRDVETLRAIPQGILTQDEKDKLDTAKTNISNMIWQDYSRQKAMRDDARAEEERAFKNAAVTRFYKTGAIDPDKDAMDANGVIDFTRRDYLIALQKSSSIPEHVSNRNMIVLENDLMDAGTTGNYQALLGESSRLGQRVSQGYQPTIAELADEINDREDLRPEEKIALQKKLPELMRGAALLQSPEIERAFRDELGLDMELALKNEALGQVILMRVPTVQADIRRIFFNEVRAGFKSSIDGGKGIPRGEAERQIYERAAAKARATWERVLKSRGEETPPGPNQRMGAAGQNTTQQQSAAQAQGTPSAPKVGDVVNGHMFKGGDPSVQTNWQMVDTTTTNSTPEQAAPTAPPREPTSDVTSRRDTIGMTVRERSAYNRAVAEERLGTPPEMAKSVQQWLQGGAKSVQSFFRTVAGDINRGVEDRKVQTYIETQPSLKQEFDGFEERIKAAKTKAEEQAIGSELAARYSQIKEYMIDTGYMQTAPAQKKPKPYAEALDDLETEIVLDSKFPGRDKPIIRKKEK